MSYAKERADAIGLSEEENTIKVWQATKEGQAICDLKLLSTDSTREDNMLILYLSLEMREGAFVPMTHKSTMLDAFTQLDKEIEVVYYNCRIKVHKPGMPKYRNPSGVAAQPFLSPWIVKAWYERKSIDTLILVEGAMKALKGCLCGLMVIGINGIWGMREAKGKELHPIIQEVMATCNVKNLIYLHDNDCRDISVKYGNDVLMRPLGFAQSVIHFSRAAKNWRHANPKAKDFNWYYAHIKDGEAKGLDDLLIELGKKSQSLVQEAVSELNIGSIEKAEAKSTGADTENVETTASEPKPLKHIALFNLRSEMKTVASIKAYFYLDSIERFFEHHSNQLELDPFIYSGDLYRFNEDTEQLECTMSGAASQYVLVGNRYLQDIFQTNSKGLPELVREHRFNNIIIDDFKRKGLKNPNDLMLQIPKYDNYANEPDFLNYQREITVKEKFKMLNLAYPLEDEPIEGAWPQTHLFLSHIFHNGGDSKLEVGLDMIQMYFTKPKQKQRILSLVSKENETGKTTFLLWLREIFGQNMSIVGSADFKSQFNGYVTKSLVGVDESKIDDAAAIEAIKSLVSNPYSMLNEKNSPAKQIVNHVKLIMTTNHIFDFAHISQEENKWFVIEVGKIAKRDNALQDKLKEEIPAFLYYLKNRELAHYSHESRFAIPDELVLTKALRRVQENSKPQLVAQIEEYVKGFFRDYERPVLKIDAKRLYECLFPERNTRFSNFDIEKILKNEFDLFPSACSEYFKIPIVTIIDEMIDEDSGEVVSEAQTIVKWENKTGKIYTFLREDWLK